jgi:hypothetical protein
LCCYHAVSSECTCSNIATAAKDPSCEGSALIQQIGFSLAAFLTVYSPRYSYYGVSSGYMDGDFPWHDEFDHNYGAPLENATDHGEYRSYLLTVALQLTMPACLTAGDSSLNSCMIVVCAFVLHVVCMCCLCVCHAGDGSFHRRFEHVTVQLNCRTGEANYQWTTKD